MQGSRALLTAYEAARKLGISHQRVRQLIYAKRLPARRFGRAWVIAAADLDRVKDRRPGRPPKRRGGAAKAAGGL